MHFYRHALSCLMTAALILAWQADESWAQSDPAAGQVLFREARQLVEAGELEAACPKFEESYRLALGSGRFTILPTVSSAPGALRALGRASSM